MTDEMNTNEVVGEVQAEAPASVQPEPKPVLNPVEVAEPPTAQMEGNEPLTVENAQSEPESVSARPLVDSAEVKAEPAPTLETPTQAPEHSSPASESQTAQIPRNEPLDSVPSKSLEAVPPTAPIIAQPSRNFINGLLAKARISIQSRKRKKLDRIMTLFEKRTNITNDEVEKLLHISDATATRYLNILEQEGKIKQAGKTGKFVSYTKI